MGMDVNVRRTATSRGHNSIPFVAPWLVALALLLLALPVRFVLAADAAYAWAWSPLTLGMYAAIAYGAHRATRPRGQNTHVLVTGAAAAGGAWSWVLATLPGLTWRPFAVYFMGMLVACVVGNLLLTFRQGEHGEGGMAGIHGRLAKALDKVQNVSGITTENGSVVAEIVAEPGSSIDDLQKSDVPKVLESLHDLPEGSVQITKGKPGSSTRVGTVRLTAVDLLATPAPWPGVVTTGTGVFGFGTIMDPIRIGVRQTGRPLEFYLPGDAKAGRNAALVQVTGMSGAGKSEGIRKMLVTLMSRGGPMEVEYWYLNPRKFDQEPDWVREGAARAEGDKAGVRGALRELEAEMPGRAKLLGQARYEQWALGAPVPYRLVIVDEFAAIAKDVERTVVNLGETLRSLGVGLVLGLQRATYDRMPTSLRANLNLDLCFGVEDADDATYALPEKALNALGEGGPHLWQASKPGACYLAGVGIDEQLWAEPGRTYDRAPELLQQWASHLIALRNGQPTTAPATALDVHVAEGELVDYPAPAAASPAADVDLDDDDLLVPDDADVENIDHLDGAVAADLIRDAAADLDDDEDEPYDDEDDDLERVHIPADVADVHAMTDADDPDPSAGVGMRLALTPKMSDAAARGHLRQYLERIAAAGDSTVKVGDILEDVLDATGMKASWLSKWVGTWADDPDDTLLARTASRGVYRLAPPRSITAR